MDKKLMLNNYTIAYQIIHCIAQENFQSSSFTTTTKKLKCKKEPQTALFHRQNHEIM